MQRLEHLAARGDHDAAARLMTLAYRRGDVSSMLTAGRLLVKAQRFGDVPTDAAIRLLSEATLRDDRSLIHGAAFTLRRRRRIRPILEAARALNERARERLFWMSPRGRVNTFQRGVTFRDPNHPWRLLPLDHRGPSASLDPITEPIAAIEVELRWRLRRLDGLELQVLTLDDHAAFVETLSRAYDLVHSLGGREACALGFSILETLLSCADVDRPRSWIDALRKRWPGLTVLERDTLLVIFARGAVDGRGSDGAQWRYDRNARRWRNGIDSRVAHASTHKLASRGIVEQDMDTGLWVLGREAPPLPSLDLLDLPAANWREA